MNNPTCPQCDHKFSWVESLKNIMGSSRQGTAMWGLICPSCQADLKVPNTRVLLIVSSAIFFGSQSSTLMVLSEVPLWQFYLVKVFLILGFYSIAIFIFLRLELVQK